MRIIRRRELRRAPRRRQRDVLRDVMLSARECETWLTLDGLAKLTHYPPASISAQLRHLRKLQAWRGATLRQQCHGFHLRLSRKILSHRHHARRVCQQHRSKRALCHPITEDHQIAGCCSFALCRHHDLLTTCKGFDQKGRQGGRCRYRRSWASRHQVSRSQRRRGLRLHHFRK